MSYALTVIVVILIGVIFWWLLHNKPSTTTKLNPLNQSVKSGAGQTVKDSVSYQVPAGYQEASCTSSPNVVYIVPSGTSSDCSANPTTAIRMSIDSQNITDCQQLKPATTEGIKKHTCSSLFIHGKKSLKNLTTINNATTQDYYINEGSEVIKVEYTYSGSPDWQAAFDELAMSVQSK